MTGRAASPAPRTRAGATRAAAPARVAALLCASGCCALIYQVAWLRLLRLIFGGSTAASAAVLAIFMGGLGLGGLLLGKRADRAPNPLRLYGQLELGVALAAALSPLLIAVARSVYIALGGAATLGSGGATLVRLALAAVVLGLPTPLMGGTLPAAVRAVEIGGDLRRRRAGLLYAANTLGAVLGALAANFALLELLGTRVTIWFAAGLNLAVAAVALGLARRVVVAVGAPVEASGSPSLPRRGSGGGREKPDLEARAGGAAGRRKPPPGPLLGNEGEQDPTAADTPTWLVLAAAGLVGFAFLLMELVWYRMLAPLLGGSSYTFGLILAVGLLGIGVGGLLYAAGDRRRRPTLTAFALTCALEAVLIALPYALGDGVAIIALLQRPAGGAGFLALVRGWTVVTALVVLPAAVVAGYQFPLLIGLLGSGERRVGQEVGWAYASNTFGSIFGSLAGGFGLLPLLSAPGAWRAVVYLLAAGATVAAVYAARTGIALRRAALPVALALAGVGLCGTRGPTAFWRHTAIGAGRVDLPEGAQANAVRALVHRQREVIVWEAEGVESSVAVQKENGLALLVNGKSDGNAIGDAPTQVMQGLIGAAFHPNPQRALVVGLGTGETVGWLAQVPSIERVDVLELEPSVVHVAELCAPVNGNVLDNPKVHIMFGDAREFLLTMSNTYDIIVSEPSNPYRAGTASLFTKEFYAAAAARLTEQGVFTQWVQAYEVQADTMRTIYATLGAVFPSVETWETLLGDDLAFLARKRTPVYDIGMLRSRLAREPYRRALPLVWGVNGVEGLFTGFVAGQRFAADYPLQATPLNTDDRTVLEWQFARSVGQEGLFDVQRDLRSVAAERGEQNVQIANGTIDGPAVEELRAVRVLAEESSVHLPVGASDAAMTTRLQARAAFAAGNFPEARRLWLSQAAEPQAPGDVRMVAEILADAADERATGYIDALRPSKPAEAEALLALWQHRANQPAAAAQHLTNAFRIRRQHPWSQRGVFKRALDLAYRLSREHPELRPGLFDALSEPFAVWELDLLRLLTRAHMGADSDALCAAGFAPFEPEVPWEQQFLDARADCYRRTGSPLAERAGADAGRFRRSAATASSWVDLVGVGL